VAGDALIIEHSNQFQQLDYRRPLSLFAQTTQDPIAFLQLCSNIKEQYLQHGVDPASCFRAFNTICKQVAERRPILHQFAKSHHTLIFVSGRESSNGKVLFDACKEANPHSFQIENSKELCRDWFSVKTLVGVCGATSTPKWLMEEVAQAIKEM
jgi:4-hydroxy-3-methylbut-2-enyl diphosphate reductase